MRWGLVVTQKTKSISESRIEVLELWAKYEDIAMHFNDLLIRLRVQALAGVAALATLVSIFTSVETRALRGTWEIASFVFGALCFYWLAIWVLDLLYYNKLLIGAVRAIVALEEKSDRGAAVENIEMSRVIEKTVWGKFEMPFPWYSRWYLLRGVYLFYSIVFLSLVGGLVVCLQNAGALPKILSAISNFAVPYR